MVEQRVRRLPQYRCCEMNASGIAAYRRAFQPFQALIQISAWNAGDMRGWFQVILGSPAEPDPPMCRGFTSKRLMGFEPTTFCMASDPPRSCFRRLEPKADSAPLNYSIVSGTVRLGLGSETASLPKRLATPLVWGGAWDRWK
jgi:hypothetical protein